MRRWLIPAALALSGCGDTAAPVIEATASPAATVAAATAAATVRPDLAKCEKLKPDAGESERQRTGPLTFPAEFAGLVATDRDHVAVVTLGGATLCIDATGHDEARDAWRSRDGRFFGYHWSGYEAYGFVLIDRAGSGREFETGEKPVIAPSGRRMAAVEWSESGYGGLNGVLVLAIERDKLRELGRTENLPDGYTDWRLDKWVRDGCFTLSAVKFADYPDDGEITAKTPRDGFIALETNKLWAVEARDACPAA